MSPPVGVVSAYVVYAEGQEAVCGKCGLVRSVAVVSVLVSVPWLSPSPPPPPFPTLAHTHASLSRHGSISLVGPDGW